MITISASQSSVLCLFPQENIPGLEAFRRKHIHHPGERIPFHVTLMHQFLDPDQVNSEVVEQLQAIAQATPRFRFQAKSFSCFPTTKVLYLTPTPQGPLEELSTRLYSAFPTCHDPARGFPIFHMTLALGYPQEHIDAIIAEYFSIFGRSPLSLTAHHLGICAQQGDCWHRLATIKLGRA